MFSTLLLPFPASGVADPLLCAVPPGPIVTVVLNGPVRVIDPVNTPPPPPPPPMSAPPEPPPATTKYSRESGPPVTTNGPGDVHT